MKIRIRYAILILLIIGVFATIAFRTNYSSRDGNFKYESLSPENFIKMAQEEKEHIFYYLYNKHEIKNSGIQKDDQIKWIYLVQGDNAEVFVPKSKLIMDNIISLNEDEIIRDLNKGELSGIKVNKIDQNFVFNLKEKGDYLDFNIKRENSLTSPYQFIQAVNIKDLRQKIKLNDKEFYGYFHESSSVDRFLTYQCEGIISYLN